MLDWHMQTISSGESFITRLQGRFGYDREKAYKNSGSRTVYKRKCPNLLILLANKLATLITIKGSAAIIQVRDNQSQQPGNIVLTRQ